jgi:hypothetical protein
MTRWRIGVLAALLAVGGGSTSGAAAVLTAPGTATLHFHAGRQSISFRLHEPAGVIDLYRISVLRGTKLRASVQWPRVTAPLRIATRPAGPSSSCRRTETRVVCTVGEEGCPMNEATWTVRVEKLAGPAGDATLTFRVRKPPSWGR